MRNINKYNIVKWYKMLTGKSILHVNQGIGQVYSKKEIGGYYNDLTEKVLRGDNFEGVEIPKIKTEMGKEIIFPVAVFQYGLGALIFGGIYENSNNRYRLCRLSDRGMFGRFW